MRRLLVVCLLCLMIAVPLHAQDDPYAIALQRIEEAREMNATDLILVGFGLTEVPPEIGQLDNLRVLYLGNNQLTSLPSEIGQLTNLQRLELGGNQLTSLPSEIGQLNNLQQLDLVYNQLTSLPPEIGQLTNLQYLNVSHNHLTNMPSQIGQLTNLKRLWLHFNQLRHLPPDMSNLSNLTCAECYLILHENPLISPPPEVVEQGTAAVLEYLRNQAWYHTQRLIIGAAAGVGLLVLLVLGVRWKQRGGRKPKQKRTV